MTPLTVLLVEDNPADVMLIRTLLTEHDPTLSLVVARDGEEAIATVQDAAVGSRADLILLDLNLPRKTGAEVLEELKAHPELRRIPVVMLTSSSADRDVRDAYDHHANAFVVKPTDFDRFSKIIEGIDNFWCRVASLSTASSRD